MPEVALPGRIDAEIAFTERWANIQGSLFYGLTGFKVVAAASIPIILSLVSTDSARLWAGVMGGLVSNSRNIHGFLFIKGPIHPEAIGVRSAQTRAFAVPRSCGCICRDGDSREIVG